MVDLDLSFVDGLFMNFEFSKLRKKDEGVWTIKIGAKFSYIYHYNSCQYSRMVFIITTSIRLLKDSQIVRGCINLLLLKLCNLFCAQKCNLYTIAFSMS